MNVTVVKEFRFEAAHFLPGYDGPCQFLHGHSYRLQVGLEGPVDLDTGMVVDFKEVKQLVTNLFAGLDHSLLNSVDLPGFPTHNPTAENMVVWMFGRVSTALAERSVNVKFVRLWETETSYAEVNA